MTAFTIITGLATLVGFFLQIRGMFPQYRKYYSAATFFTLGLTIGTAIAAFSGTTIQLPQSITPKNLMGFLLFGGSAILVFICFVASAFTTDKDRRSELSKIASAVSGFLIFILLFFTSTFFQDSSSSLNYDEQIQLAVYAIDHQNFDRGIKLLNGAKSMLKPNDPRLDGINSLIDKAIAQQAAIPTISTQTSGSPSAPPQTKQSP